MTTMNIAQAKAKLSELVARAEAGEDVVLTRNGKPAVRLEPVRQARKPRGPIKLGLYEHLNLKIPESVFFERDLELEEAAHGPIVPPEPE